MILALHNHKYRHRRFTKIQKKRRKGEKSRCFQTTKREEETGKGVAIKIRS